MGHEPRVYGLELINKPTALRGPTTMYITTGQQVTYNGKAAVIVRRFGALIEIKIVATGVKVAVLPGEITC